MAASLVSQIEQLIASWRKRAGEDKAYVDRCEGESDHLSMAVGSRGAFELCADDLEAVCRAWQAEQGWRDIASAPKDGSWIIGYESAHRIRAISWGVNRGGQHVWCYETGWCSPTHWMPLPDPPVSSPTATEE